MTDIASALVRESWVADLVTNAVDAIVTIDRQSRILLWNPAAETMFGYSQWDVMDKDLAQLIIPPEFRKAHYRGMNHLIATGEGPLLNKTIEIVALRKDGERFPVELSIFQTQHQTEPMFTAIIRDITERKHLEEELQVRSEELERLLENRSNRLETVEKREQLAREITKTIRSEIELGRILQLTAEKMGLFTNADRCVIWLIDPQTRQMSSSPYEYLRDERFKSILESEEPVLPLMPGGLNPFDFAKLTDISQLEGLTSQELKQIEKLQLTGFPQAPILYHIPILYQGNLLGIIRIHSILDTCDWSEETVALVKDIANQVAVAISHAQILEQARQNERRFRAVFDNTLHFISILDDEGCYVDVNPAQCDFLGFDRQELIGKKPGDIYTSEASNKLVAMWSELMQEGILKGDIMLAIRDSGKRAYLEYSAVANFLPGLHLLIAHDISQRKSIEEQLKHYTVALEEFADKLLRSNRELEQFATVASHDLQAPLRKIMMFSDWLQESERAQLSETGQDYLGRMQKAARKMQDLITDLLALSRINRRVEAFRPVQLEEVIAEVLHELETEITQAQAVITVEPLCTVEADHKQMLQLFFNLIENSLKFHRVDCPPRVSISAVLEDEKSCRIKVTDEGIGFKQEFSGRIFEIFERLHGESTYQGTGIGLAICQKITERHGGTISAEGIEGEGTTFVIHLPLKQPNKQDSSKLPG